MTDTTTTVYTVTRDPSRSRDFENLAAMTPALEDLAEKLHRHLRLFNPHGTAHPRWMLNDRITALWPEDELSNEEVAYVVFWSSPVEGTIYEHIPSLFGREDLNPSSISSPFARSTAPSVPLLDDNGIFFGEVEENVIYISFDLPHMDNAGEIMRLMVPRIVETFESGNDPEFLEDLKRRRYDAMVATFVNACQGRNRMRSRSLQTSINDTANRLGILRQDMLNAQQMLEDYRIEYRAAKIAEGLRSKNKDKYASEFAALDGNKKIEDIVVTDTYLIIKTVNLVSQWLSDDTRRNLGKFEIKIPFSSTNGETDGYIYLKNLTNSHQNTGQPHPHARSETNICWGNLSTGVSMLQGDLEFGALAELIIKFLEEPNPDDPWGESIWEGWQSIAEKRDENTVPRFEANTRIEEEFCGYCDNHYDDCTCCYACSDEGLDCGSYNGDCITWCDTHEEEGHDCELCPCA